MVAINFIIQTLNEAIQNIKALSKDPITDNEATQMLCSVIESLFLHGQDDGTYQKLSRFIRRSTARNPNDYNFWVFIKHYLPKTLIEIVEMSSTQRTHIGCCRVWVRLALNESTLISYLEAVQMDEHRLQQFYTEEAILRTKDSIQAVIQKLKAELMNGELAFHLNLTCPILNTWSQSKALQLAKIDCVLYEEAVIMVGPGKKSPENASSRTISPSSQTNPADAQETRRSSASVSSSQSITTTDAAHCVISQLSGPSVANKNGTGEGRWSPGGGSLHLHSSEDEQSAPVLNTFVSPLLSQALDRQANLIMQRHHAESLTKKSAPEIPPVVNHSSETRRLVSLSTVSRESLDDGPRTTSGRPSEYRRSSSASIAPGSNSLIQGSGSWWSPGEEASQKDSNDNEEDNIAPSSYSDLWAQAVPNLGQALAARDFFGYSSSSTTPPPTTDDSIAPPDSSLPSTTNGPTKSKRQFMTSTDSAAHSETSGSGSKKSDSPLDRQSQKSVFSSSDSPRPDNENSTRHSSIISHHDTKSLTADDWQLIGDDLNQSTCETKRLLEIYPGVDKVDAINGENTQYGFCANCELRFVQNEFALDFYDGRFYCNQCHADEQAIIPRDVLNNWDFTPKPVSIETRRFLTSILTHPNLNLSQRNPLLCATVPVLVRLRSLRHQLSILWNQLTACNAKAASALRQRLFPRDYMLGSLQEIDLYSLEDLIIANSGGLESHLQNAMDKTALPHVRSCKNCRAQSYLCDLCQLKSKPIHLYMVDTYKRCSTHNCPRLIHTTCLSANSRTVYCNHCKFHLDRQCQVSLGEYDTSFPQ